MVDDRFSLVGFGRLDGFLQFEGTVSDKAGRDEYDECHWLSFVKFAFYYAAGVPIFYKDSQAIGNKVIKNISQINQADPFGFFRQCFAV